MDSLRDISPKLIPSNSQPGLPASPATGVRNQLFEEVSEDLLAAGSLVLMGKTSTQFTEWVQGAADIAHLTDTPAKSIATPDSPAWLIPMMKGQVIHDKSAPYQEIRDSLTLISHRF